VPAVCGQGWDEALLTMKIGGRRILIIPVLVSTRAVPCASNIPCPPFALAPGAGGARPPEGRRAERARSPGRKPLFRQHFPKVASGAHCARTVTCCFMPTGLFKNHFLFVSFGKCPPLNILFILENFKSAHLTDSCSTKIFLLHESGVFLWEDRRRWLF